MEEEIIKWQAPEYNYTEKSSEWFWAFGIISISLIVASFIAMNITLAIIFILGAFSLMMLAVKKPFNVNIEINNKGILIGNSFYPYKNLDSFGIEYYKDHVLLIIHSKKMIMPQISIIIDIDQVDPEYVKEYLENFLEEKDHAESVVYKISEKIGL